MVGRRKAIPEGTRIAPSRLSVKLPPTTARRTHLLPGTDALCDRPYITLPSSRVKQRATFVRHMRRLTETEMDTDDSGLSDEWLDDAV